ncbi:MAG: LacI family DNA-binding transcriptional regulator [Chloroflexi bacterium]|nr:LacI family DNA-binding transcriptional regulator [Chloroflexota bacterium]
MSGRISIHDIAKAADVSRSTVSRVVNHDVNVSPETRARVLEVIERLQYTPNHAARALVKQRSQVIGVVMPGTANVFFGDNSYFPMLLQGIVEAGNHHDQNLLLCLGNVGEPREHFSQRILRNRIGDGYIIASIENDDPLIDHLVQSAPNFVMVERPQRYADVISSVTVDNVHAGQVATEHLISLGYKRIAHISGQLSIADGQDRLEGYRRALAVANIPYDPDLIYVSQFTYEAGVEAMRALLHHQPDAVFAACDASARGAIAAVQQAGLRVPEDIGIVGFDDLDVATKTTPHLTTIQQPVQQKGAAAVELLLDLISGKKVSPQQIVLPSKLVIRESCGAKIRKAISAKEVQSPSVFT